MKKKITQKLWIIVSAFMLLVLAVNYILQITQVEKDAYANSQDLFWQIKKVLHQNELELESEQEAYRVSYLVDAQTAAYIIALKDDIANDVPELNKIAAMLDLDEIHFFDDQGNLYGGNIPTYWGMSMDSGNQIGFFKAMLGDKTLSLVQGVEPNTAEEKPMQYAAVWREDGKEIIQVGKTPQRVLDAMKRNELSYIFSLVAADSDATIWAIDPKTYKILGSTDESYINQSCADLGLTLEDLQLKGTGKIVTINGKTSYAVFDNTGSVVLCHILPLRVLFHDVNQNTVMLALYMVLIIIVMIVVILRFLDQFIIREISGISEKMAVISAGDLDTRIAINSTPELKLLSEQINYMIESLINNMDRTSTVLDVASIPIAVYEYYPAMKRVMATRRIGEILGLTQQETQAILSDHDLLEEKLDQLRGQPFDQEKGIYKLQGVERFIRMDTIDSAPNVVGILMDVTNDTLERQVIEHERDMDILTNLYNRRAFYRIMDDVFRNEDTLGYGMVLAADADGLKHVNDQYGHENGDRYLCGIADIMRSCKANNKILARMGGDEFTLVVYGCKDEAAVHAYAQDICQGMGQYSVKLSNELTIPIRFSVGYAMFPREGQDHLALAKIADTRMYAKKNSL